MARRVPKILVPAIVGVPAIVLGVVAMAPSFAGSTAPERKAPVELVTNPAGRVTPNAVSEPLRRPGKPNGGCVNCMNHLP